MDLFGSNLEYLVYKNRSIAAKIIEIAQIMPQILIKLGISLATMGVPQLRQTTEIQTTPSDLGCDGQQREVLPEPTRTVPTKWIGAERWVGPPSELAIVGESQTGGDDGDVVRRGHLWGSAQPRTNVLGMGFPAPWAAVDNTITTMTNAEATTITLLAEPLEEEGSASDSDPSEYDVDSEGEVILPTIDLEEGEDEVSVGLAGEEGLGGGQEEIIGGVPLGIDIGKEEVMKDQRGVFFVSGQNGFG